MVEKEIQTNFGENEKIEIVFISHVDQDHINGLEYLLKHCDVKNIVFPYTKKEDRILLTVSYLCANSSPSYDDFTYKFINNPRFAVDQAVGQFDRDVTLWAILENNEGENNNREYIYEEGIDQTIYRLPSKENLSKRILGAEFSYETNWEYVPFNFREDKRKEQFISNLKDNFKKSGLSCDENILDDIWTHWKDTKVKNAIIDAYKKVNGSLNANSMTLFSGIKDNNVHQWQRKPRNKCYCCHACIDCFDYYFRKNGCLYTGDYEANGVSKWIELKKAYSGYWDYIGCVQIPHHGSYRNYNQEFATLDAYFVISAGSNNRFRHPSGSVIKNLFLKGKHPFIVTEQRNSKVILEIDI